LDPDELEVCVGKLAEREGAGEATSEVGMADGVDNGSTTNPALELATGVTVVIGIVTPLCADGSE
jgi:hypothetical protein